MRKELVLGVFVLLSISFVFAGTCDDSQTIMRLYRADNSHVSFWNVSNDTYLEEVCYNDIYGWDFIGSNPHECSEGNRVVSLYSESNSHASAYSDQYYDKEVCYGDLVCAYENTVDATCANGGEIVARMSTDYNAHVGTSTSAYTVKVCCVSNKAYWADMNGNIITRADFGDTVQLIYRGENVQNMFIREADILADDDIRVITPELNGDGVVVGIWKISDSDLDKTTDYNNFYFEVDGEQSDYLEILTSGDDEDMDITIISPECGSYYDNGGSSVLVSITASDVDDMIDGEVSIDGEKIGNFSNGGLEFNHIFESSGDFQVLVEATNSRGKKFRTVSNIMVLAKSGSSYLDGEYVAACIVSPKDYAHIDGSTVNFDASTTRGIRITNGALKLLVPGQDAFSWYWNFQPEDVDRVLEGTSDEFAYKFTAGFPIAGENSASLRVEI